MIFCCIEGKGVEAFFAGTEEKEKSAAKMRDEVMGK